MNSLQATPFSPALLPGEGQQALAHEIASLCPACVVSVRLSRFADGESRVLVDAQLPDADAFILQSASQHPDERLFQIAQMCDGARSAGARRITAVMPYFGYARQDVRRQAGEPHSARLAARMLEVAGVDRVLTLELHSPALESAFDIPVTQLQADELLLPALRHWDIKDLIVVSPDAGGAKRAQRIATALNAPLALVAKSRPAPDQSHPATVLGAVGGRCCLIVDDMASTGGTIAGAALALREAGALEVHAVFIHAVMAPGALERIISAGVGRILTTDSVGPVSASGAEVLSVAPLLAQAICRLAGRPAKAVES